MVLDIHSFVLLIVGHVRLRIGMIYRHDHRPNIIHLLSPIYDLCDLQP